MTKRKKYGKYFAEKRIFGLREISSPLENSIA
jgi:hypothetical protein